MLRRTQAHTHPHMHTHTGNSNSVLHCHLQRHTAISCTIRRYLFLSLCMDSLAYLYVKLCMHASMCQFWGGLSVTDNSIQGAADVTDSLMTCSVAGMCLIEHSLLNSHLITEPPSADPS